MYVCMVCAYVHIMWVRQQKHVRWNATKGHYNNYNNTKYILYIFFSKNWKKWTVSGSNSRNLCDNTLMKCEFFPDFKANRWRFRVQSLHKIGNKCINIWLKKFKKQQKLYHFCVIKFKILLLGECTGGYIEN